MITKTKQLPRDESGNILRSFKANGRNYTIWTPDELGILRYVEMTKMSSVVAYNASLVEQFNNWTEAEKLVNECAVGKSRYVDLALHITASRKGISDASNDRFDKVLRYCCIFILRDNEDPTSVIEAEQEDKLNDWAVEGYRYIDFFQVAVKLTHGYQDIIKTTTGLTLADYMDSTAPTPTE